MKRTATCFSASHARCGCTGNASTSAGAPCPAYIYAATVPIRPTLPDGELSSNTAAGRAMGGTRRCLLWRTRRFGLFDDCVRGGMKAVVIERGGYKETKTCYMNFKKQAGGGNAGHARQRVFMHLC